MFESKSPATNASTRCTYVGMKGLIGRAASDNRILSGPEAGGRFSRISGHPRQPRVSYRQAPTLLGNSLQVDRWIFAASLELVGPGAAPALL